nr:hypothetical protein PECWAHUG_PECWAHUG_CDS_0009 [Microvirus sp.]
MDWKSALQHFIDGCPIIAFLVVLFTHLFKKFKRKD